MNTQPFIEETAEQQIERRADGQEVFSRDEIRFEDALEVVKGRMADGCHAIQSKGWGRGTLSFTARFNIDSALVFAFEAYTDAPGFPDGVDIEEVIRKIPIPEDTKTERIAELRAELARLEAETKG